MELSEEIDELREVLRSYRGLLGWSQRQLADRIFVETSDDDDEAERDKHFERLRKALQKGPPTAKRRDALFRCVRFVEGTDDFLRLGCPRYSWTPGQLLPETLRKGMRRISRMLEEEIQKAAEREAAGLGRIRGEE